MMNNYGKVWLIGLALALVTLMIQTNLVTRPTYAAGLWHIGLGNTDNETCASAPLHCITINGALKPGSIAGDAIPVTTNIYTDTNGGVILSDEDITHGEQERNFTTQSVTSSTKTVDKSTALPGDPLTYTIVVNNSGTPTTIHVTDILPITTTYISNSLTATGGGYGYENGVITWTGSISTGGIVTITYGATISQTAPLGTFIENSAVISGSGEVITRSATVEVKPQVIYLPIISRNYCPPGPYADDFGDPSSGWPVVDTENARLEYLTGEYRILMKRANWWVGARPSIKATDYTVSVDVRRTTSGIVGSYGLIFGLSDDWNQFYSFEILPHNIPPSNNYVISRYNSGNWTPLAAGFSTKISPIWDATHQLKIERNGSLTKAYINGQLLTSVSDGSFVGSRHVGLIVATDSSYPPDVDVRFDNFSMSPICGLAATILSGAGQIPGLNERTFEIRLPDNWAENPNHKNAKR